MEGNTCPYRLSVVVMLECPPLLYELCVRPCGDQQRRARVPQVVEPEPLLLSWQRRLGRTEHAPHEHRAFELRQLALVAVESSECSAAGLVRYLRSQGMRVLEVNQPMRTRADAWARAIRSMPSWPRGGRSPAR